MLADHLGIELAFIEVTVDAECDVRGCLLVDPTVPVGFQRMHCRVQLQPMHDADDEAIRMLLAAAERSCVVLQTLRNGVTVETEIGARHRATVDVPAAASRDARDPALPS
jgi:uncharacterized OsmC-like protein